MQQNLRKSLALPNIKECLSTSRWRFQARFRARILGSVNGIISSQHDVASMIWNIYIINTCLRHIWSFNHFHLLTLARSFRTKGLRRKRPIRLVSIQVVKDPMFLRAFDCTDTEKFVFGCLVIIQETLLHVNDMHRMDRASFVECVLYHQHGRYMRIRLKSLKACAIIILVH